MRVESINVGAVETLRWRDDEALGRAFSCITVYDLYRAKLYHHNEKEWLLLQSVVKHPALAEAWRKAILELRKIHSAR